MEKEILDEIKKRIETLENKKKKYQRISARLKELQENEFVKEYLGILQDLDISDLEKVLELADEHMLSTIYHELFPRINNTNDIWMYMGSFNFSDASDLCIEFDSKNIKISRKKDILGETSDYARRALTLYDDEDYEYLKGKSGDNNSSQKLVRTYDHNPGALFHLYINIENNRQFKANFLNWKKFEREHIVIYSNETDFDKVQDEFYNLAVEQGQEEACKQIIKKYKLNIG